MVDVSDIFLLGGGERGVRATGRRVGVGFLLKIPGGGGEGGGRGGWEGVCREFGGGGVKFFFSGPKRTPRKRHMNI